MGVVGVVCGGCEGVGGSGVRIETGECDRAFFHESLLKAPGGRGPSGSRVSLLVQCP